MADEVLARSASGDRMVAALTRCQDIHAGATTHPLCCEHKAELERSINRHTYVDPRAGRRLFKSLADEVLGSRLDHRESTRVRDSAVMRSLVLPTFGDLQLNAVTPYQIESWIASLVRLGKSPATIRKAYELLAGVFRVAVRDSTLARTPCRDIRLPPSQHREMRFLQPEEIDLLLGAIEERHEAMVLLGAYGGLRFGEMAGLRINEDLDLLRRRVTINRTLVEVSGNVKFGPPKTAASRRTVALPEFVVDAIAVRLSANPATANGLVFTSAEGLPLRRTNFGRRVWRPAVDASVGQPMRTHDLRHSHVAILIAQAEHPKTIAARLGHTSVKQVLDRYGHVFEGLDLAAADGLNAAFLQRRADSARTESGLQASPHAS